MTKIDLETIGRKRGDHHREEVLDVVANCDYTRSAERWCQENVLYGWVNKKHWFSFDRPQDAQAFRDLWGDE